MNKPRFTIERCTKTSGHPRTYGYVLRDNQPKTQTHEDVEGVGVVPITPRKIHFVGWARRRAVIDQMAADRNQWFEEGKIA